LYFRFYDITYSISRDSCSIVRLFDGRGRARARGRRADEEGWF
jgi:hypothetical protein